MKTGILAVLFSLSAMAFLSNCTSSNGPSDTPPPAAKNVPSSKQVRFAALSAQLEAFSKKLDEYKACVAQAGQDCARLEQELNGTMFTAVGTQ